MDSVRLEDYPINDSIPILEIGGSYRLLNDFVFFAYLLKENIFFSKFKKDNTILKCNLSGWHMPAFTANFHGQIEECHIRIDGQYLDFPVLDYWPTIDVIESYIPVSQAFLSAGTQLYLDNKGLIYGPSSKAKYHIDGRVYKCYS